MCGSYILSYLRLIVEFRDHLFICGPNKAEIALPHPLLGASARILLERAYTNHPPWQEPGHTENCHGNSNKETPCKEINHQTNDPQGFCQEDRGP
jgi:hypothetical protein